MRGNASEVRSPIPSFNRDGSPETFVTASAWFSKTPSASLGEETTIDKGAGTPSYPTVSNDQLSVSAQSGDQQAFVDLYRRHSPMAKKRIVSTVRNHEGAEYALHDTLRRAYRHLDAFRRTCKLSTWLTRIGTNTALMMLRRRKTRREAHADALNGESEAWEATELVDPSIDC